MANHNKHYTRLKIEPWDIIKEDLGHDAFVAFCKGNIIKYTLRNKEGKKDIEKALHYCQALVEELE